eukprot:Em0018g99a
MGDNGNGDDENIAYPLAEVYRHTMLRGAGLGSLAATVFGAPFLLYRGARGVLLFKRLGKVSLFGTGAGASGIAVKTYLRLQDQSDIQVWDRAYRLRHNEKQVRVDLWTYGGLAVGGLAGSLLAVPRVMAAIYGASIGCGFSFLAGMANNLPKK